MKFFNRYDKEDNFRWVGFHLLKTTFGFGFSFGKPWWLFPMIKFSINEFVTHQYISRRILDIGLGWLFFCFRIQILYGVKYNGGVSLSFGEQRQCTMATLSKIADGRKIALAGVLLDCNSLTKEERREVWEEYFSSFPKERRNK